MAGSYNVSQIATHADREIRRLRAQADLFWPQEWTLYQRLGITEGMRVLDCGCGPGHLLKRLTTMLPALACSGVEVDPLLVDVARQTLAGCTDCEILQGSILDIPFPPATFDFTIVRLVVEHVPNPLGALQEVARVLKPGATAVIIDNDFDLHERTLPDSPALAVLYDAYRRARRAEGGNPCIGRELPGLLQQAGFSDVDLHFLAAHSRVLGDSAFLRAEGMGIPAQLARQGYLSEAALEQVAREWQAMLEAPDHAIVRMLFAAVGKAPAPDPGSRPTACAESKLLPRSIARLDDQSLTSSNPPETPEDLPGITEFIRNSLAQEMDVPAANLTDDVSLLELGLDSISALGLCNRVKNTLQVTLPIAEVLRGDSILVLADKVSALVAANPAPQSSSDDSAIRVQPRDWQSTSGHDQRGVPAI